MEIFKSNSITVAWTTYGSISSFKNSSLQKMFSFAFHTSFLDSKGTKLAIPKRDIDVAYKDKKHFQSNFKVDVIFKPLVSNPQKGIEAGMDSFKAENPEFSCGVCHDPIFFGEDSLYNNQTYYHWDCTKCSKCSKSLSGLPVVILNDESIICSDCEARGLFPTCSKCNILIKDEPGGTSEGNCWHQDCFRCQSCNNALVTGGIFCSRRLHILSVLCH